MKSSIFEFYCVVGKITRELPLSAHVIKASSVSLVFMLLMALVSVFVLCVCVCVCVCVSGFIVL
jgi:hypothetical protein